MNIEKSIQKIKKILNRTNNSDFNQLKLFKLKYKKTKDLCWIGTIYNIGGRLN
jgi:hypothetical protein